MDLKLPGYEREVVEGLRERGLSERSLISSQYLESIDRLRELEPDVRRGWSVPRAHATTPAPSGRCPPTGCSR